MLSRTRFTFAMTTIFLGGVGLLGTADYLGTYLDCWRGYKYFESKFLEENGYAPEPSEARGLREICIAVGAGNSE